MLASKCDHLDVIGREGETILRFDDTNPEAEKLEFIDNIMEDVAWLGWKPCKVNFASDNFDKLYEYAVQLIKMGKAFGDHPNHVQYDLLPCTSAYALTLLCL